ncbi:MAG: hypothetical protein ACI8XM_003119, partial [Haloarculaceae archaeon]
MPVKRSRATVKVVRRDDASHRSVSVSTCSSQHTSQFDPDR